MQPTMWKPCVAPNSQEEQIVNKIRKAKLFVFLRQHRHEVFDKALTCREASLSAQSEKQFLPVQGADIAYGFAQFAGADHAAHDLTGACFGQGRHEL